MVDSGWARWNEVSKSTHDSYSLYTQYHDSLSLCLSVVSYSDCAIGHGAAHYLSEKFGRDSDGDVQHLCPKCRTLCKNQCAEHPDAQLDLVHVPQAFSLLVSELRAMNVAARLTVNRSQ